MICVCGCGALAAELHHVVKRQTLRREAPRADYLTLVADPRNMVGLSLQCHGNVTNASVPLRLAILPDSVYEFAREVLGAGLAYNTLRRAHSGEDPRLEALLHGAREGGSMTKQRVLALVGVYRADFDDEKHRSGIEPVVAATLPDHAWEHMTDEEVGEKWKDAKAMYDPSGFDYAWREVWIELDPASLRAPFEIPAIVATVVDPA